MKKNDSPKMTKAPADTIRRVFMLQLLSPLGDETWESIGTHLHDLRDFSFRMFNAGIMATALADDPEFQRMQREFADKTGEPFYPPSAKAKTAAAAKEAKGETAELSSTVHPSTHAYRQINAQLDSYRGWNASQAEKVTPSDQRAPAHFDRRANLNVPSTVAAYASKLSSSAYFAKRKEIRRGDASLPTYRKGGPIQFTRKDFELLQDDKGFVLEARLRERGRTRFAVVPCGGTDRGLVAEFFAKRSTILDLKLVWQPKDKKWLAKISCDRPRPPRPKTDFAKKIAVHRGVRNFLTWWCGDQGDVLCDGGILKKHKSRLDQKAASIRKQMRRRQGASHGHGTSRRFEPYRVLENKIDNFVKSFCQEQAAHICDLAEKYGAGTIVMEDYSSRELADDVEASGDEHVARFLRKWPFYKLRMAIESCAEKRGLKVEIVASQYESCTCPKCGNVDTSQDDGRGTFTCSREGCRVKRSVDAVACWNMLRRAGDSAAVDATNKKLARAAKRFKPGRGDAAGASA